MEHALRLARQVYGEGHPQVAVLLNMLGSLAFLKVCPPRAGNVQLAFLLLCSVCCAPQTFGRRGGCFLKILDRQLNI